MAYLTYTYGVDHLKILSGFQIFFDTLVAIFQDFKWFSSGFQKPFKIWTICKPIKFSPSKIWMHPDFRSPQCKIDFRPNMPTFPFYAFIRFNAEKYLTEPAKKEVVNLLINSTQVKLGRFPKYSSIPH